VKVVAVTPSASASDPKHPDHDRWVKEKTIAMEVAHAERIGATLRDAEAENARLLARAEQLAKRTAPIAAPRKPREKRLQDRGVTVRAPKEISLLKLSPCGRCGTCRNCMRERRVLLIVQKRKDGGALGALASRLKNVTDQFIMRVGTFKDLSKGDRDRALTAAVEEICNLSFPHLGDWR
jgi:hypothetical protein